MDSYPVSQYANAFNDAVRQARQFNRPMGIEAAKEYGRAVLRVKMIPIKPCDRFGWETRCEVVTPDAPMMSE